MAWFDNALGAITITATAAYTVCVLSHVVTTWTLRNEFEVAVR